MRNILEILSLIQQIENVDSDSKLLDVLAVSASTLSTWKKRGTIPFDVLFRYCDEKNIILNWLLTGKGPSQLITSHSVHEGEPGYDDPKDSIIVQLERENERLRKLVSFIDKLCIDYKHLTENQTGSKKKAI